MKTLSSYASNLEHIRDELARLDLLIRRAVSSCRRSHSPNEMPGLYISDSEVEALLSRGNGGGDTSSMPEDNDLLGLIRKATAEIDQRVFQSVEEGVPLVFQRLAGIFELSPFEKDIVLICLAPHVDLKYQKLYAYLQDDITRKHPTVELMQILLCADFEERIRASQSLGPGSPLVKYRIVSLERDPSETHEHFPALRMRLDSRIAAFLLGSNSLSDEILPFSSVSYPPEIPPDPTLPADILSTASGLLSSYLEGDKGDQVVFSFYGPDSEGKKKMAAAACQAMGLPLLAADSGGIIRSGNGLEGMLSLVLREGLLQPAAVYLENADAAIKSEDAAISYPRAINRLFQKMGCIVFLSSLSPWPREGMDDGQMFFEFAFPVLPFHERVSYWKHALNGNNPPDDCIDLQSIAGKFRFTRSQIRDSVSSARNMAFLRDRDSAQVTGDDLIAAARLCSNQNIISFGRKIAPKYVWDDIVLPHDNKAHLKELCSHVKFHPMVYGTWGFERKHNLGRGVNILFSGPSGTGKTMAAEVIANELKLDLYKIDLSTVVSKYIGETEKNLSRIFAEAETSNAIIFFDEADALFGKRSEVRDSHDRYANIEVNYLLQKMEEHEGIVILATNMNKNLDDAFTRRMHFAINFPSPEKEQRMLIWQGIYPGEVPLGDDIDFHFLAKQLHIPGGNIKNIAVRSAFLAAEESSDVGMKHIVLASKREYQKMGKLCMENDFKQYFELVR